MTDNISATDLANVAVRFRGCSLKSVKLGGLEPSGVEWYRCGGLRAGSAHPQSRYRGTSLIRNRTLLGPYSRAIYRALWWS